MPLDDSLFTAEERLESLKAALLTGMVAGLVQAMLLLIHRRLALGWAAALASVTQGLGGWTFWVGCAIALLSGSLFGLTYRYAVRQDHNPQLKSGVITAFGLVRGLAQVDAGSALAQHSWPFVAASIESLLLFSFAGAALELSFQQGWVKRFGG